MTCGIYSITNKETGKMYIGQSIDIERRFRNHIISGSPKSYIDRSIKKHGKESFDFKIILRCDESELLDEESKFIKLFGTYKNGYNLTWGGEINPSKCPEIAKKISESNKGEKAYWYGKNFSEQMKLKMSRKKNSTGYYGVYKKKKIDCKQGFTWVYQYRENKKYKTISCTDLKELKKKVLEKGLHWEIINELHAKQSLTENTQNCQQNKQISKLNTSGILNVSKTKDSTVKQGFLWQYNYYEQSKKKKISRVKPFDLKEVVLSKGFEWIVVDEEKAKANGLI